MFRKDPVAVTEWSTDLVSLCSHRQARILDQTGVLVKGGGYLIYSTCTFNDQENEAKVRMLVEEFSFQPVRIPLIADWGIVESRIDTADGNFYGYRFYPHKVNGEGFFISVLKRPDDCFQQTAKKAKDFKHPFIKPVSMQEATAISKQLLWGKKAFFYQLQGSYFWFNPDFQVQFEYLTQFLNIRYFGVELGKPNKGQWIPSHEWAMSLLSKKGFQTLELGLEDALSFLRKEDRFFENCPEGWVLITFRGLPLGWVKNLGNRLNNYYPKEWRIKKA
jgi:NOL1/NOP2/fmu family ribosome biogenesis protein